MEYQKRLASRQMRTILFAAMVGPAALGAMSFAQAQTQTCFRACLASKLTSSAVADEEIRSFMKGCRDDCEAEARERLASRGLAAEIAACIPEPVADADLKKIRSASPSFLAYANAFTWDLHNILDNKVIVRMEMTTQNLGLQDVVMSAGGTALPGETTTFLISGFFDGYPSVRVTTRIKAIYACELK
jgi:hypothetical protein